MLEYFPGMDASRNIVYFASCAAIHQHVNQPDKVQTIILGDIISLVGQLDSGLMYINGPSGCGKRYLMNIIIHYLHASKAAVVTAASLGVAELILVYGVEFLDL